MPPFDSTRDVLDAPDSPDEPEPVRGGQLGDRLDPDQARRLREFGNATDPRSTQTQTAADLEPPAVTELITAADAIEHYRTGERWARAAAAAARKMDEQEAEGSTANLALVQTLASVQTLAALAQTHALLAQAAALTLSVPPRLQIDLK